MINKKLLSVVTSPKLHLDNSYKIIDEDGLLSQKIFGPVKNYKCKCEKYASKITHAEKRCPICNVLCTSNEVRFKTFAKIVIPFIIYKNTRIVKNKLRTIIGESKHIIDPMQSDLSLTTNQFLFMDTQNNKLYLTKDYSLYDTVPIQVTGIYSLYIALICGYRVYNNIECYNVLKLCFDNEIIVTPPGLRPVILNNENGYKKIRINSINEYYIHLIRITKYDWVLIGEKNIVNYYIDLVNNNKFPIFPIIDKELKNYDEIVSKYQYYVNKIYFETIDSLSGKEGYIRKDFLGRTVDFSSRCHIIINPNLRSYEITIPKVVFSTLWFIEYLRYLSIYKKYEMETLLNYVKITEIKTEIDHLKHIDEFIDYWFNNGEVPEHKKLVLINRQPTLWRYGIPAVKVIGITNGDAIAVSPLLLEPLNADFDGDSVAIIRVHDNEAQLELQEKAFFLNNIFYDHNNSHIQNIRLEVIYAEFILLSPLNNNIEPIKINSIFDIEDSYENGVNYLYPISINNNIYTVGICLFNRWCNFKDIKITKFTSPELITSEIYKDSKTNEEFHTRLINLKLRLIWFISTHPTETLTVVLDELTIDISPIKNLLIKLPENPYIGQHLYEGLTSRAYDILPDSYKIKKLTKIKIRKAQLARLIGTVGFIADDKNIIDSKSISQSILSGLDQETFFRTCYGTRKGIVDKSNITPKSGYLERSLVMNLSPIELDMDDCKSNIGFTILINSIEHAKSLKHRWYYKTDNELELYDPIDLRNEVGKRRIFRSPITCQNPNFKICKKCFGHYPNIQSPFIGILSGQYISERLTQLSLRTFHSSGSCTLETNPLVVKIMYNCLEDIINNELSNSSTLIFNRKLFEYEIYEFQNILGYVKSTLVNSKTHLIYSNLYNVMNQDVSVIIKNINNLLKNEKKKSNIVSVDVTYSEFMKYMLSIGDVYSIFIEIILCNMYLTKDDQVLRYALKYNPAVQPYSKLGVKQLNKIISKLLGLLYEPNEITISRYADQNINIPIKNDTIFEKFWEGQF
jgi:DNA-directed RNA polymerase beta' subunit